MLENISYLRDDGSYISHEDLEERCIKYVRNIRIGLNMEVTREKLENWLKNDCRLSLLPPSNILDNWLEKWTLRYLAEWSYDNDFINTRKSN